MFLCNCSEKQTIDASFVISLCSNDGEFVRRCCDYCTFKPPESALASCHGLGKLVLRSDVMNAKNGPQVFKI